LKPDPHSGPILGFLRTRDDHPDDAAAVGDWYGVGDMVAITIEQISAPVEGMHRAIVDRWLRMAGPRVEPSRRLVDGLIASIYKTVRLGASALGSSISVGFDLSTERVRLRPVWETPKGRYVQAIFNGVWGDILDKDQSPLGIELGLRDLDGSLISTDSASLGGAFPCPRARLALMVHGFGDTERRWRSDASPTLCERLEAEGFSVLHLRYNTGRAIDDNGSDLADLLEAISSEWPVEIEEIALIGHSMGGLVNRSAVAVGRSNGYTWVDVATNLVSIGTPHLGSPIEKGVHSIGLGLGLFKETRPLGAFLDGRSAGVKGLRDGVSDRTEGVQYHVIAGAVTAEPDHPLGVLLGDLVVGVRSAIGSGRQRQVAPASVLVVGGRHHAELVHDPRVISQTAEWLTSGS